ncbi:MAG: hypothetical protein ABIH63_04400 [archaeon]
MKEKYYDEDGNLIDNNRIWTFTITGEKYYYKNGERIILKKGELPEMKVYVGKNFTNTLTGEKIPLRQDKK